MLKAIFISPYFPPIGGSGVFRMHRIVKYLPEFDIQPIVVHLDHLYDQPEDVSLLKELKPEVLCFQARFIEPSGRGLKHWLDSRHPGRETRLAGPITRKEKGVFLGLGAWARDRVFIPDYFITWLPSVLPLLNKLVKEHQPRAVFSTSSPETSHLVGDYLKRRFHLPWVADFRDPWMESVRANTAAWPFKVFERWMEVKILQDADIVTPYSKGLASLLQAKVSAKNQDKFCSLGPAVDASKFDQIPLAAKQYDLLYTGGLAWIYPREIFPVLDAMNRELKAEGKPLLKVGVAGRLGLKTRASLEGYVQAGWMDILGYLPHYEAISLIKSARALLLLHPDYDWWVPGKVSEYLYSGKPILAMVGEGELKDLLKNHNGVVFSRSDSDSLRQNILNVLNQKEGPRILTKELTARGQAEIVAELLRKVVKKGS